MYSIMITQLSNQRIGNIMDITTPNLHDALEQVEKLQQTIEALVSDVALGSSQYSVLFKPNISDEAADVIRENITASTYNEEGEAITFSLHRIKTALESEDSCLHKLIDEKDKAVLNAINDMTTLYIEFDDKLPF